MCTPIYVHMSDPPVRQNLWSRKFIFPRVPRRMLTMICTRGSCTLAFACECACAYVRMYVRARLREYARAHKDTNVRVCVVWSNLRLQNSKSQSAQHIWFRMNRNEGSKNRARKSTSLYTKPKMSAFSSTKIKIHTMWYIHTMSYIPAMQTGLPTHPEVARATQFRV